jgi:hypothetical protein
MLSSELQYIVELGGQGLFPVPNTDLNNQIVIAAHLQILRDQAHAWFKFDTRSSKTVYIPEPFQRATW